MDEFADVIDAILNTYKSRWPGNITDLVFLAIEQNLYYLKRYHEFADGDYATTNSMIGRYVKDFTGMKPGHGNGETAKQADQDLYPTGINRDMGDILLSGKHRRKLFWNDYLPQRKVQRRPRCMSASPRCRIQGYISAKPAARW